MGQSPGHGEAMAHLLHVLISLGLITSLFTVVANLLCFGGLRAARPEAETPLVSILVPARNEERSIGECLRSLLAQDYPYCEVIMLDDGSQDATAKIAQGLGLSETGSIARMIRGQPLPEGWTGKNWACHQLARQARGEYLFFTDADTEHKHGTVSALVDYARRHQADLVSAWPRLVTVTWAEKIVLPMIMLLAMMLYPHWMLILLQRFPAIAARIPVQGRRMFGAANGQSLFFRRVAYDRIGGHEAVRDHLVEDVALGRAVAARMDEGLRLFNCDALRFSTCRMYRSFGEVWEGFTKNLRAAFEGSLAGFLAMGIVQFGCLLLPFLLLFQRHASCDCAVKEVGLIYLIRVIVTVRFRTSWASCILHPIGQTLGLAIGLNSWRRLVGPGVTWKGRTYSKSAGIS